MKTKTTMKIWINDPVGPRFQLFHGCPDLIHSSLTSISNLESYITCLAHRHDGQRMDLLALQLQCNYYNYNYYTSTATNILKHY